MELFAAPKINPPDVEIRVIRSVRLDGKPESQRRSAPSGAEIPVGILTAMLGGPFFIWLLLNRKGDLEL